MQAAKIIWFTGLSGSGKTTLANMLFSYLSENEISSKIIDGDAIRKKDKNNSFGKSDIIINNERIMELCKQLQMDYDYLLVAVISPFEETRRKARDIFVNRYIEVFVKASMKTVIKRDIKGLYKKDLSKNKRYMIGLNPMLPYEEPDRSEIVINTDYEKPEESLNRVIQLLALQ